MNLDAGTVLSGLQRIAENDAEQAADDEGGVEGDGGAGVVDGAADGVPEQ